MVMDYGAFSAAALKGAALAASKNRGLYAFNGLAVQADMVCGCNGRRMHVVTHKGKEHETWLTALETVIVPLDALVDACTKADKVGIKGVLQSFKGPSDVAVRETRYSPVEGEFPDVGAVMKDAIKGATGEGSIAVCLSPQLLMDACKAALALQGNKGTPQLTLRLAPADDKHPGRTLRPVVIEASGDTESFIGIVMPIMS